MAQPLDVDEVLARGRAAGLDAVGVAPAAPFEGTRAVLEARKQAGLHGGMAFTYRNPARSTSPGRIVDGARSLVVGARRYPATVPARPTGPVLGRVARYAWVDHYGALRVGLQAIATALRDAGWRAVVVADDNALVDREAARRAGLGWYGKNANLLLPGQGSWFVLGSVVTDAPLPPAREPVADACGACRRCLDGCPTGAIIEPGVVDANRCLAWLVQRAGSFPREHRAALGDRLYGCDDCQEVCPPNRRALARHEPTPSPAADLDDSPGQAWVDVLDLLAATDDELVARHGRWYIPRREPRWLRRNALVILGNTAPAHDRRVVATLARYLRDGDPHLRAHAAWAADRLGLRHLLAEVADDADPIVQEELAALGS